MTLNEKIELNTIMYYFSCFVLLCRILSLSIYRRMVSLGISRAIWTAHRLRHLPTLTPRRTPPSSTPLLISSQQIQVCELCFYTSIPTWLHARNKSHNCCSTYVFSAFVGPNIWEFFFYSQKFSAYSIFSLKNILTRI